MVHALKHWMGAARANLSRHVAVAKAIDYILTHWEAFTRFHNDGRICLSKNAADASYAVWLPAESRGYPPNRSAGAERRPCVHAHPPSKTQRR
jgi:hypothetical protein